MPRILLLVVCLAIAATAAAETPRVVPVAVHGGVAGDYGARYVVASDVDGDGIAELVSCSAGAPYAISVKDGTFATVWRGATAGCTAAVVTDRDGNGSPEVVTVSGLLLMSYDPRGVAGPTARVTMPAGAVAANIVAGNVDADATPEIVIVTLQATHVFDGATLTLQWTAAGYGGHSVAIGDVDGDSQREIIVSGTNGHVLDAVAKTEKWGYVGGFSDAWDVGNVDADPKDEIVFNSAYQEVTVLHGDTQATTTWTADWFDTLAIGDTNGDGVPDVLTGNNQWGDIEGHHPVTGALLWSIANPGHGTLVVGTARLDGDAQPEVFWSSGHMLYVTDTLPGSPRLITPQFDSSLRSMVGDVDGDGENEFVVSGRYDSENYATPRKLEVRDFRTGAVERSFDLPPDYGSHSVLGLAMGQLDADPQREIAALIGHTLLVVWDSESGEVQFTSANASYTAGSDDDPFLVANLDGDAVDEIVIATASSVLVLNGASNIIQKTIPDSSSPYLDFALADLNGDSKRELLIASSSGLRVYDTTSWAVLGSATFTGTLREVDATAADGGTIVLTLSTYSSSILKVFKGAALAPAYECARESSVNARFGQVAGEERLLVAEPGKLSFFPLAGAACPTVESVAAPLTVKSIVMADPSSDERNELLITGSDSVTVALLGVASETRGDSDHDGVITVGDIDATADYVFGASDDGSSSADANADERIGVEDIFQLIHHELAGGPAPQP